MPPLGGIFLCTFLCALCIFPRTSYRLFAAYVCSEAQKNRVYYCQITKMEVKNDGTFQIR